MLNGIFVKMVRTLYACKQYLWNVGGRHPSTYFRPRWRRKV